MFDLAGIRDASTADCHLDGERTLTTNSVRLRVWNVRSLSWEWPDREGATGRSATPVPRIAPSVIELPAKHGPDGPLQTIAAA